MNIPDAKASVDKVCEKARKVASMESDESEEQKKIHRRGAERGKGRFTLLQCWTYVTSRTRIWSKSSKKYKGRRRTPRWCCGGRFGLLRSLTERGSSASHMTAAKVLDVMPGCAGQASDAVSAYTQVKMEDAPKLLKIPK